MKRAIVLTSQRTGSVFLEQCLNSHPDITCYGEILLGYGGKYTHMPPNFIRPFRRLRTAWQAIASGAALFPAKTIQSVYSDASESKFVAYRLMYNQLRRDSRVGKYMLGLEDLRVIHLTRRNLLKRYVSLYLMHNERKVGRRAAHTKSSLPPAQVRIDPAVALQELRKSKAEQAKYRELFSKFDAIEVEYESMIDGPQLSSAVAGEVCDFLEVPRSVMTSGLVKMNPAKVSDMVANYDELAGKLAGTEFSDLLD